MCRHDAGGRPGSLARRSALSALHYRVEFAELDAGVLGRELPIGLGGGGVAPMLPGLDVTLQRRPVADPVRQSLPRRRPGSRPRALNSISAILSQEPCLGVWWISSRSARRLASSGANAS